MIFHGIFQEFCVTFADYCAKMKRFRLTLLAVLLVATGCGDRYFYIDFAASELQYRRLAEGFSAADTLPGGRRAFLESQGENVADILFCTDSPALPEIPYGYNADTIGTRALVEDLQARRGHLFDSRGRHFSILFLLQDELTMPMLRKIDTLASQGAFIGGTRPVSTPESADSALFHDTVTRIWRNGNVMSGTTPRSVLRAEGTIQDMKTRTRGLAFTHRRLPEAEIYHVTAPEGRIDGKVVLKLRVTGRTPEIWDPATGKIRPVSYKIKARKTKVVLRDGVSDVYLVFCRHADRRKLKIK